jgi:hypothetical protein
VPAGRSNDEIELGPVIGRRLRLGAAHQVAG